MRGIITLFLFVALTSYYLHISLFVIVIEELRLAKRKHKHDTDLAYYCFASES